MSSEITNLGNLWFLVLAGPWQVAPSPPLILGAIVIFSVALHCASPRMKGLLLGICVSMAAAAFHIAIVVGVNGPGPLVGLGFVAAIIAFYPVSIVFVLILRRYIQFLSSPECRIRHGKWGRL